MHATSIIVASVMILKGNVIMYNLFFNDFGSGNI